MNTPEKYSIKVLDTTEAELSKKLKNIGFKRDAERVILTQELMNPNTQKTFTVQERDGIITRREEDGSIDVVNKDPLNPDMHTFQGVVKQLTSEKYSGKWASTIEGFALRTNKQVEYIFRRGQWDDNERDKIIMRFNTIRSRFQTLIPPYVKIITSKEGELSIIIDFLGLRGKQNLTVDNVYEYYKKLQAKN